MPLVPNKNSDKSYIDKIELLAYRKPPNISPGLIFVRKHFGGLIHGELIYGGLIYGQDFVLVIDNTRLIYKQA